MDGFHERIFKIDLTKKSYSVEQIEKDILETCLGGKGLAIYLLLRYNPPGVNPLSPDNHLIFATGPVTGTSVLGSCRHGVFTKSPQTGFLSESYSGGKAAEFMSRTGHDAFMINGAADEPIWIEINEDGAVFHSAENLWGLDTFETEDRIKAWLMQNRTGAKNSGVVCIGPAGENLVTFAVIENDYWRSAGRTGVGAVMGSKKIKAIAFWGKKQKIPAKPDIVNNFVKNFITEAKDSPVVKAYKSMGTPMLVDITNQAGSFPARYWHKGRVDYVDKINAAALHARLDVKPHACLKCFMACGRLGTVKEGRHKGLKIEGPEYETIYAFGGLCEIDSIEEIAYLNDLCDRLGLDTITAGNLAAFTIEAAALGKVNYNIRYGEVDSIADLLKKITYRKGIGDLLAQGIKTAADEWGMQDHAIHVKGLEPAGYDPRVLKGMGLAYATSDRGACHLRATFYKPELSGLVDPNQIEGKAKIFAEWEDRLTIFDTLILCRFYRDLYQWEELLTIIEGTVGLKLDKEKIRSIAASVTDNARMFNLREGLTPEDDHLPKRFLKEALPETGQTITKAQIKQLVREYYKVRGWTEMGVPPSI